MLENLKTQLQRLISSFEKERAENAALRAQVEKDKEEIIALNARTIELNKQIDSLKLTAVFSGSSTIDDGAKDKVDKLIREIDHCISLIEQ